MRIVIAEPWLTGSHESWARGYADHSQHDVEVVGLPGRLWRWRLRAGSVPLADALRRSFQAHGRPDVLVVSGLVDVSSLLGLLRHDLPSGTPVVTYMHESQLLYPTVDGNVDDEAVLRNWHSWCASDLVLFNSGFHRDAIVDAMPGWLASLPDDDQQQQWRAVAERFEVLPVGVDMPIGSRATPPTEPPIIVWPHRWEPDKAPEVFARAADKLAAAGVPFRLVLAGPDPTGSPVRRRIIDDHHERIMASGPFTREDYVELLRASDIVVSCAEHEFFGVAVVEAILAGCVPVLPNALSYPEIIPSAWHDAVLYEPGTFGTRLLEVVRDAPAMAEAVGDLAGALGDVRWEHLAGRYDERFVAIEPTLTS